MKNKLIVCCFLLVAFILLNGFQPKDKATQALEQVKQQFQNGMSTVVTSIEALEQVAINFQNTPYDIEVLQQAIINTRLDYKKIEYFHAYFDEESILQSINGAPIPKLEKYIPEVVTIQPSGLQVLDEIIFSDDPFQQKEEIIELVKKLKTNYQDVQRYQSAIKITHRHVFESIRQGFIRVFTLGLTGFDTPGSVNAIAEAKASLQGAYEAYKAYTPLVTEKSVGLAIVLDAHIESTLKYLNDHQDFETFDRLHFLKKFLDPQYQLFYELHKELSVEFTEEVNDLPTAVNYHSTSIFAGDFLNAGYYANMDISDPLMDDRIELGRLLFFDPILSSNNERACASCHQPEKAFTDGLVKSTATDFKGTVKRNSPTLVNSVYSDKYFWDLRENRLDKQMLHVIKNKHEFNTDYIQIIDKLKQSSVYDSLFMEAYPTLKNYTLSTHTISNALAAYVTSLTDFNSPFDQYVRGEIATIDPSVIRGFNLFMGKAVCGTCHFAPVFNGTVPPFYKESESEVLAVPMANDTINVVPDTDLGRHANQLPTDKADIYKHSFKTVTVRNAALTAPYMHNGVYNTLEEVVDFYNRGGGAGMGWKLAHQTLPFDNLELTTDEQADIVAFLESLTGDMSTFTVPDRLPIFENKPEWNDRVIGGQY